MEWLRDSCAKEKNAGVPLQNQVWKLGGVTAPVLGQHMPVNHGMAFLSAPGTTEAGKWLCEGC